MDVGVILIDKGEVILLDLAVKNFYQKDTLLIYLVLLIMPSKEDIDKIISAMTSQPPSYIMKMLLTCINYLVSSLMAYQNSKCLI